MNLIRLICLLLLLSNTPSLFSQNKSALYFDSGKADLKPESETTLQSLVAKVLTFSDVDLRIEAFTDDKGTETFNRQLAQQRAETVRRYLLTHQISLQKLDIRSIGELALDEKEADMEESRRKNRRVDVYFNPVTISNINDLSKRMIAPSTITRDIQPDKATTIVGANGVKVNIPSDAFVFQNGTQPKNAVKITLKEALKPDDWIFNNLTTVATDGQIMSSGGMFNLEATSDGKPLTLAEGKKLSIAVPSATKANPEMQFFYGNNHNAAAPQPVAWRDNKADWEEANANNDQRSYFVWNLARRYNPCTVKNTYPSPELKDLDMRLLSIAIKPKPEPPLLEELVVPKIKNFDNIPLPKGGLAKKKEIKKREEIIAKSEASFDKRKEIYEQKIAAFKKEMEVYRTDSTNYVLARKHLIEGRSKIHAYETQLVKNMAIEDFNRTISRMQYNLKFRKYMMTENAFKDSVTYQNHRESIYKNLDYNKKRLALGLAIYDTAYTFLSQIVIKKHKLDDEYNRLIDSSLQASNFLTINAGVQKEYNDWLQNKLSLSINEVNEYVGEVTKMGWINVDVFYKYDAQSARPVALKESEEARTFLICKKINAILPMMRSADRTQYGFGKVPAGLNFSVVSIKIKDGFPLLSILNFSALPTAPLVPEYKKVSVPQLKEALAAL